MTALLRLALLPTAIFSIQAQAADISVLSVQPIRGAFEELADQFTKATEHKITPVFSGSVDVRDRILRGQVFDVVITTRSGLIELAKSGKVLDQTRVDVAKSGVGVAARAGQPRPNISSVEALREMLLTAQSIAYSTGPSGNHVLDLIQKMGIFSQVQPKLKLVPSGGTVGSAIAAGDAEIGFQQVSELAQFPGIQYLGPLPAAVQFNTVFSAGIHSEAKNTEAAAAWIKFLTSSSSAAAFVNRGLDGPGS